MKKLVLLCGSIFVVGLIVFVLFSNRAEMERKANVAPITSIPVSVVAVIKQSVQTNLSQVGNIVSNNDVAVASEVQGKVTAVYVAEGAYVAAGAPLVKIDDTISEAKFLSSETSYQKAKNDWDRKQALHKDGAISDSDLELARQVYKTAEADYVSNQRQYQNSVIASPISGVVSSRPVNIGAMINPGTVVANVVDVSLFKVQVSVGEQDAFTLRVGDRVVIETDVYPGVKFTGRIQSISVKGDEAHTYPVQVVLPNSKQYPLRSGMFGRVSFKSGSQVALVIPRDALVGSIKEPQVFVVEDGKAKLTDILIGAENGTNVIVRQGLSAGETVVVSGQDNLRDDAEVTIQK